MSGLPTDELEPAAARERHRTAGTTVDRLSLLVVAALTLIGLAIRLAGAGQSLASDELFAWWEISDKSLVQVVESIRSSIEVSPPLFFLLARMGQHFGDPTVTIRLPSLIAGTLLIPAVYLLGRETVTKRAALFASALTTTSSIGVFYSVEARPYGMLALASALSTLFLLRSLRTNRTWDWAGYAIAASSVVYLHYSGIFLLAAQFIWAAITARERIRHLIIASAAGALLYAPWIAEVGLKQTGANTTPDFTASTRILESVLRLWFGFPFAFKPSQFPGTVPTIIFVAAFAVAAVAAVVRVTTRGPRQPSPEGASVEIRTGGGPGRRHIALLFLLLVASPAGMFAASAFTDRAFVEARYLIASIAAAMVLAGALLDSAGRKLGAALAVIAIGASAWCCSMLFEPRFQRADARAAAKWIDASGPQKAVILDLFSGVAGPRPLGPYLRIPARDTPKVLMAGVLVPALSVDQLLLIATMKKTDAFIAFNECGDYAKNVEPPGQWAKFFAYAGSKSGPGYTCGYTVKHYRFREPSR